jgi:PAS domain-containing protein
VVGATSLQRLTEVALAGLQPEVGATRAILGVVRRGGDLRLRAGGGPAAGGGRAGGRRGAGGVLRHRRRVPLTDPFGRVTAMNRALEALTGWTENEARGRPYADVLPVAGEQLLTRYGRKVTVLAPGPAQHGRAGPPDAVAGRLNPVGATAVAAMV